MSVESSESLRMACPKDREERNYKSVLGVLPRDSLLSRGFCRLLMVILWTGDFALA